MSVIQRVRLLRRTYSTPSTPIEVAQQEAALLGLDISVDEADAIIWNFTGFPSFWPNGFQEWTDAMRHQLRSALLEREGPPTAGDAMRDRPISQEDM